MEDSNLILICEGGAHTVEYFHKNGIFPSRAVFDSTKFREMSPYLQKEDEILVVLTGLTDFTLNEVYALLRDLEESKDKFRGYTVISSMHLGSISNTYYIYNGDLFYGIMQKVENKVITDHAVGLDKKKGTKKNNQAKKKGKNIGQRNFKLESSSINAVMSGYKIYSKRDVRLTIYGTEEKEPVVSYEDADVLNKIVRVDLFRPIQKEEG